MGDEMHEHRHAIRQALVAGAFSMGTGEYVSVTNQNELVHAEVATERTAHAPEPEVNYWVRSYVTLIGKAFAL